jgi:hypothetical protein
MDDERLVELLGRAAAVEFALGSIIKHLPGDARKAVQGDLRLFLERSGVASIWQECRRCSAKPS